jgi:hypothetical protein
LVLLRDCEVRQIWVDTSTPNPLLVGTDNFGLDCFSIRRDSHYCKNIQELFPIRNLANAITPVPWQISMAEQEGLVARRYEGKTNPS